MPVEVKVARTSSLPGSRASSCWRDTFLTTAESSCHLYGVLNGRLATELLHGDNSSSVPEQSRLLEVVNANHPVLTVVSSSNGVFCGAVTGAGDVFVWSETDGSEECDSYRIVSSAITNDVDTWLPCGDDECPMAGLSAAVSDCGNVIAVLRGDILYVGTAVQDGASSTIGYAWVTTLFQDKSLNTHYQDTVWQSPCLLLYSSMGIGAPELFCSAVSRSLQDGSFHLRKDVFSISMHQTGATNSQTSSSANPLAAEKSALLQSVSSSYGQLKENAFQTDVSSILDAKPANSGNLGDSSLPESTGCCIVRPSADGQSMLAVAVNHDALMLTTVQVVMSDLRHSLLLPYAQALHHRCEGHDLSPFNSARWWQVKAMTWIMGGNWLAVLNVAGMLLIFSCSGDIVWMQQDGVMDIAMTLEPLMAVSKPSEEDDEGASFRVLSGSNRILYWCENSKLLLVTDGLSYHILKLQLNGRSSRARNYTSRHLKSATAFLRGAREESLEFLLCGDTGIFGGSKPNSTDTSLVEELITNSDTVLIASLADSNIPLHLSQIGEEGRLLIWSIAVHGSNSGINLESIYGTCKSCVAIATGFLSIIQMLLCKMRPTFQYLSRILDRLNTLCDACLALAEDSASDMACCKQTTLSCATRFASICPGLLTSRLAYRKATSKAQRKSFLSPAFKTLMSLAMKMMLASRRTYAEPVIMVLCHACYQMILMTCESGDEGHDVQQCIPPAPIPSESSGSCQLSVIACMAEELLRNGPVLNAADAKLDVVDDCWRSCVHLTKSVFEQIKADTGYTELPAPNQLANGTPKSRTLSQAIEHVLTILMVMVGQGPSEVSDDTTTTSSPIQQHQYADDDKVLSTPVSHDSMAISDGDAEALFQNALNIVESNNVFTSDKESVSQQKQARSRHSVLAIDPSSSHAESNNSIRHDWTSDLSSSMASAMEMISISDLSKSSSVHIEPGQVMNTEVPPLDSAITDVSNSLTGQLEELSVNKETNTDGDERGHVEETPSVQHSAIDVGNSSAEHSMYTVADSDDLSNEDSTVDDNTFHGVQATSTPCRAASLKTFSDTIRSSASEGTGRLSMLSLNDSVDNQFRASHNSNEDLAMASELGSESSSTVTEQCTPHSLSRSLPCEPSESERSHKVDVSSPSPLPQNVSLDNRSTQKETDKDDHVSPVPIQVVSRATTPGVSTPSVERQAHHNAGDPLSRSSSHRSPIHQHGTERCSDSRGSTVNTTAASINSRLSHSSVQHSKVSLDQQRGTNHPNLQDQLDQLWRMGMLLGLQPSLLAVDSQNTIPPSLPGQGDLVDSHTGVRCEPSLRSTDDSAPKLPKIPRRAKRVSAHHGDLIGKARSTEIQLPRSESNNCKKHWRHHPARAWESVLSDSSAAMSTSRASCDSSKQSSCEGDSSDTSMPIVLPTAGLKESQGESNRHISYSSAPSAAPSTVPDRERSQTHCIRAWSEAITYDSAGAEKSTINDRYRRTKNPVGVPEPAIHEAYLTIHHGHKPKKFGENILSGPTRARSPSPRPTLELKRGVSSSQNPVKFAEGLMDVPPDGDYDVVFPRRSRSRKNGQGRKQSRSQKAPRIGQSDDIWEGMQAQDYAGLPSSLIRGGFKSVWGQDGNSNIRARKPSARNGSVSRKSQESHPSVCGLEEEQQLLTPTDIMSEAGDQHTSHLQATATEKRTGPSQGSPKDTTVGLVPEDHQYCPATLSSSSMDFTAVSAMGQSGDVHLADDGPVSEPEASSQGSKSPEVETDAPGIVRSESIGAAAHHSSVTHTNASVQTEDIVSISPPTSASMSPPPDFRVPAPYEPVSRVLPQSAVLSMRFGSGFPQDPSLDMQGTISQEWKNFLSVVDITPEHINANITESVPSLVPVGDAEDIKFKEDVPQHHDDDQLPMSDLPTLDSAVIQPEDVPPSSDAVVYQPSVPDRQSRLIAVEAQLSLFDQQLQAIEATARHVEKEYGQAGQVVRTLEHLQEANPTFVPSRSRVFPPPAQAKAVSRSPRSPPLLHTQTPKEECAAGGSDAELPSQSGRSVAVATMETQDSLSSDAPISPTILEEEEVLGNAPEQANSASSQFQVTVIEGEENATETVPDSLEELPVDASGLSPTADREIATPPLSSTRLNSDHTDGSISDLSALNEGDSLVPGLRAESGTMTPAASSAAEDYDNDWSGTSSKVVDSSASGLQVSRDITDDKANLFASESLPSSLVANLSPDTVSLVENAELVGGEEDLVPPHYPDSEGFGQTVEFTDTFFTRDSPGGGMGTYGTSPLSDNIPDESSEQYGNSLHLQDLHSPRDHNLKSTFSLSPPGLQGTVTLKPRLTTDWRKSPQARMEDMKRIYLGKGKKTSGRIPVSQSVNRTPVKKPRELEVAPQPKPKAMPMLSTADVRKIFAVPGPESKKRDSTEQENLQRWMAQKRQERQAEYHQRQTELRTQEHQPFKPKAISGKQPSLLKIKEQREAAARRDREKRIEDAFSLMGDMLAKPSQSKKSLYSQPDPKDFVQLSDDVVTSTPARKVDSSVYPFDTISSGGGSVIAASGVGSGSSGSIMSNIDWNYIDQILNTT